MERRRERGENAPKTFNVSRAAIRCCQGLQERVIVPDQISTLVLDAHHEWQGHWQGIDFSPAESPQSATNAFFAGPI